MAGHELPLTFHFSKASQVRPRAAPRKPSRGSQSVARLSKQGKNDVSVASPSSGTAGQSKPHQKTLQLLTPATSARKRMRVACLEELQGEIQPPNEECTIRHNDENNTAQLDFGPTPTLRKNAIPELFSTALATPCADRRKAVKPIAIGHAAETGIATPWSSSRGTSETVHGNDDHFPLACSGYRLPSKPNRVSSTLADQGSACSPINSTCSDPFFCDHSKNSISAPRDDTFVPSKERFTQSETANGQSSNSHAIPPMPVPSSQSQYLLHIDATPKRKRFYQRSERVGSSQTQEEAELTLPTPHKFARMTGSATESFPGQSGKHTLRENSQGLRLGHNGQKSPRNSTLGRTPFGSPVNSMTSPSCSSLVTKNAPGELSFKSPKLSQRSESSPRYPPGCNTDALNGFTRHDSIGNIPSVLMEDSLTESDSDSDVLWARAKDKQSTLDPLSRETNTTQGLPVSRGELPNMEDDSATEAESDTEISRCIAEIGKKRNCEHPVQVSKEDTPPRPVISPLVSPARPRIGTMPSVISFTQTPAYDGPKSSVSGNPSYMDQSGTRSDSLPSVVWDFIRMFPGDESYPADFPESLRV